MLAVLQPETETPGPRLRPRGARPLPAGNVVALDQELLYVPSGVFAMGDDDSRLKEACRPRHRVDLGAFCIGRYTVTQADFQRYIDDNPGTPVPWL